MQYKSGMAVLYNPESRSRSGAVVMKFIRYEGQQAVLENVHGSRATVPLGHLRGEYTGNQNWVNRKVQSMAQDTKMNAIFKSPLTAALATSYVKQDKVEAFMELLAETDLTPDEFSVLATAEGQPVQDNSDRLKILVDGDSQRMVTRIYQDFISEDNFVLFIEFVKKLDRTILEFRNQARQQMRGQQQQNQDDEEGGSTRRGRRGKKRGSGGGGEDRGPALDDMADQAMNEQPAGNPNEMKEEAPEATIAKSVAHLLGQKIQSGRMITEPHKKSNQYQVKPATRADVERYAKALEAKVHKEWKDKSPPHNYVVDPGGTKFLRVVRVNGGNPENRQAHSFVELATGYILKPDGWKTPAKGIRGSIWSPGHGVEHVSEFGPGYLR